MNETLNNPPEKIDKTKKFDLDEALNTKDFPEFLADFPDAETFDMDDVGGVEKRYEVFVAFEQVKEGISDIYSKQIQEEMGVELDQNDVETIHAHLHQKAMENPAEIFALRDKMFYFNIFPSQLAALEQKVAAMGSVEDFAKKLEELRRDKNILELAQNHLGLMARSKLRYEAVKHYIQGPPQPEFPGMRLTKEDEEQIVAMNKSAKLRRAVEDVQNRFGEKIDDAGAEEVLASINEQISGIEKTLSGLGEVAVLKEKSTELFGNIRTEILGGVSDVAGLSASIHEKVRGQFRDLLGTGSLEDLDTAEQRLEDLRISRDWGDTGVDPLDSADVEKMQKGLDARMEIAARDEINKAVKNANLGKNALTKLEKTLDPYLGRDKVGSKVGDEAREFLLQTLATVSKNLKDGNGSKAKRIIIARIIAKMRKS